MCANDTDKYGLKFHDFGLNSEHSEIENHNLNYLHLQ